MFSVIIPLYNKELSIQNTLNSVLNQSFGDFEIIVINDGSSDDSRQVVERFNDSRIRLINQDNGGVSSARNRGITESKFPWVSFLDADDIWEDFHLETLARMIHGFPNDRVFCTSFVRSTESRPETIDSTVHVIEDYFKASMQKTFFWTSVTCIHSSVFKKVGCFPLGFSRGEDIELWNRIGREYRIIKSNLITATYNVEAENKLTKTEFSYTSSTLQSIHKRINTFKSTTEKRYYLKRLLIKIKYFIRRLNFDYAMRTLYRFVILLFRPVRK